MSEIEQVGPGHWVGPKDHGYQPHFFTTENAVQNYPRGRFVQEDPLQPYNYKVELDYGACMTKYMTMPYDERRSGFMGYVFESISAGGHKHFLDMRVNSLTSRGGGVFAAFFFGGMYAFCVWLTTYLSHNKPDYSLYNQIVFVCACLVILWDLFRPIPTPVRFHQKNQEVYVWHKSVLYRIPWDECEISVIIDKTHIGYGVLKDGYELTLWLNPKHAVNKNLTGQKHRRLTLENNMGKHRPCYYYWEYLRCYMDKDTSLYYELDKCSRKPRYPDTNIWRWGPFSALLIYAGLPFILFFFYPAKMTLWCGPLRRRWPKVVHEWTGEKCNWH